jgi:hypothetical protein
MTQATLAPLTTSASQPLFVGSLIETDATGQAMLTGDVGGKTCVIYLYLLSTLRAKSCSREAAQAGSAASCLDEGSATYRACTGPIANTSSAQVVIKGSWVSLTYLPASKLTLVAVLEGEAEVTPIRDLASGEPGAPIVAPAGTFVYTAPDASLAAIGRLGGVPPRRAVPLEQLPSVLEGMNQLDPRTGLWVPAVRAQAAADAMPGGWVPYVTIEESAPPTASPTPTEETSRDRRSTRTPTPTIRPTATPSPTPTFGPPAEPILLRGAGGPLGHPAAPGAFELGFPWRELLTAVYGDEAPMRLELAGSVMPNLWDATYLPGPAAESAKAAGIGRVPLLVPESEPALLELGKRAADAGQRVGIGIALRPVKWQSLAPAVAELLDAGAPVLWLAPESLSPPLPEPEVPVILLRGSGGALQGVDAPEAVRLAVEWPSALEGAFSGEPVRLLLSPGGSDALAAGDAAFDPERARMLAEKSGLQSGGLRLLTPAGDDQLASLGKRIAGALGQIGVDAALQIVPPGELPSIVKELAAAGEPVLWLERR